MKNNFRKLTAAVLAAAMTLTMSAVPASAEDDGTVIVVLGDSVSSGAQVVRNENGEFETTYLEVDYVDMICATYEFCTLYDYSVDDCTIPDLLTTLEDEAVQAALESADLILVSVGMHDMMDDFMDTSWSFMDKFGFEKFADVFTAQLADYGVTESDLQNYAADLTYAVKKNRAAAAANMLTLGEKLSVYSNAQVVYQNAYNCIDTVENFSELSANRQMAYSTICNTVSNNLNDSTDGSVNHSLNQIADLYDATVIDVHSAFKGYAYQYVNLDELDLNPSAEGHRLIADMIIAATAELKTGDVDNDGAVSATDASLILLHAADTGAGGSGTLYNNQELAADVNGDGAADATDASKVLIYAAIEGSGGTPTWD